MAKRVTTNAKEKASKSGPMTHVIKVSGGKTWPGATASSPTKTAAPTRANGSITTLTVMEFSSTAKKKGMRVCGRMMNHMEGERKLGRMVAVMRGSTCEA